MVPALVVNNGGGGGGIDRISDLHDSILCHILSLLPTKYAVRSSILSTRWKLLWTCITKLDFVDDNEGRYLDEDQDLLLLSKPLDYYNDRDEGRDKFTQFVNRVLLLRRNNPTPVHKFLLEVNVLNCDQSQLNSWICQSIELAVKELVISIKYIDKPPISLPPPCRWIHCKTLVVLELIGKMCFSIPEFASICFPSLHALKLSLITYAVARNASVKFPKVKLLALAGVLYESEDSLYKLLQSCPVLEHLRIRRWRWDNTPNLVISKPTLISLVIKIVHPFEVPLGVGACWRAKLDAPQLQSLKFVDWSKYSKPCFSVETSALNSLTKATFDIFFYKGEDIDTNYRNAVFKLIERLPSNLEHLLLVGSIMMVLLCSPPEYNITAAPVFRNLTTLDLHVYICFNWRAVMIMIKSLLQHMDNLQLLLLNHKEFCEEHESLWSDDRSLFLFEPKGILPRLRKVKVVCIEGCAHEFELLRYILLNAKHLELMTLGVHPWQKKRFQLLKIIFSMFPRGSPTCQIQLKPLSYFS